MYTLTIAGAAHTASAVPTASTVTTRVTSRSSYARPPSACVDRARTSCGTSTALSAPPISSVYRLVGTVLAVL